MNEQTVVDTEVCRCLYCGEANEDCVCFDDTAPQATTGGLEWIGTLPIVATKFSR